MVVDTHLHFIFFSFSVIIVINIALVIVVVKLVAAFQYLYALHYDRSCYGINCCHEAVKR